MSSPNPPPDGGSDLALADLDAGESLDRAFFRPLVDNGPDTVVTINEGSEMRYANRAVERVFGHGHEALGGGLWAESHGVAGDGPATACPGVRTEDDRTRRNRYHTEPRRSRV